MDQDDKKRLENIEISIHSIDITLAKQSVSLDEHIRRSNLLEEKMVPLEHHVAMTHGALKLIGLMAAIAAIIEVILQAVHG